MPWSPQTNVLAKSTIFGNEDVEKTFLKHCITFILFYYFIKKMEFEILKFRIFSNFGHLWEWYLKECQNRPFDLLCEWTDSFRCFGYIRCYFRFLDGIFFTVGNWLQISWSGFRPKRYGVVVIRWIEKHSVIYYRVHRLLALIA